jgi:hypothetical protein
LRKQIEDRRLIIADSTFSIDVVGGVKVYKNETAMVTTNLSKFYKLPVLQVDGTDQPIYQIAFVESFNLWISEWKESHKLIQEFVNVVNYEFFCNESGTIRIRPPNMSLDHLRAASPVTLTGGAATAASATAAARQVAAKAAAASSATAAAYTFVESDIYQEDTYENNSDITSVAIVTGEWAIRQNSSLDALGIFGYIKDNRLISRYGARMTNLQPVIGIVTNAGLRVWGRSMLNRINRRAFSGGTVNVIGDSSIRVGNYVYLTQSNALFYVESISHTIMPGGKYQITMGLTYRRVPYFDIAELYIKRFPTPGTTFEEQRQFATRTMNKQFAGLLTTFCLEAYVGLKNNLVADGYDAAEIDQIYDPNSAIRGLATGTCQSTLQQFYLNGYLWEFGVEISFPEAIAAENAFITASNIAAETNAATAKDSGSTGLPQGTGQLKAQKASPVQVGR